MKDRPSARFAVRLTPRAGRDEVVGVGADGELRVRVSAAPVDGAANDALLRLLAAKLDVPHTALTIVRGATGRLKLVEFARSDAEVARRLWPGIEVS